MHYKVQGSFQSPQVQASGAGTGVEGSGIQVGGQSLVHLLGVLCGKYQPDSPQSQPGKIILPVQPVELLAVEENAAAACPIPDHREFRAGLIHQLGGAKVAGTLSGLAPDQAVLRDHQGQSPVDQQFCRHCLADIPDLGQCHLKAQCRGF